MTPKGANLEGSDLLEVSTLESGSYVTRSITGQEIIDAAAGSGVTNITVNAPLATTGGTTPDLSISEADASTDGYLTAVDWNTFNDKQNALTLTTTGTSGAATLVGDTLNIPQYSGGGGTNPKAIAVSPFDGTNVSSTIATISRSILIPANTFDTNCIIEVVWGAVRISGTSSGGQSALYINTSNTLSGATLVATGSNINSTQFYCKNGRDIQKIGTAAKSMNTLPFASDYSPSTAINNFTLNNSTDLYFLFTIFAGVADVVTIRNVRITQYS
jgi:hypothetical protein